MEKIIVFGRGVYYEKKEAYLKNNFDIVAYLDNKVEGGESDSRDIPVYLPTQLDSLPILPIYVMASNKYVMEMTKQLLSLNVNPKRIRFGINIPPAYNDFEDWGARNGVEIFAKKGGICLKYKEKEVVVDNLHDFNNAMAAINRSVHPYIEVFANMPTVPANRHWGYPFGKPIDRYYIEKFLCENQRFITGDVVEIADHRYTKQFGYNVRTAYALHVYGTGDTIKGNLATGEGIIENFCDCLICTQTLQFIYDLHSTVKNIHKMLKPNGTALITVPGISQIDVEGYKRWGEAWRFTKQSLRRLFEESFTSDEIREFSWGNVKTAICFLYGMSQEDLQEEDYKVNDEMYPVILTLICRKKI